MLFTAADMLTDNDYDTATADDVCRTLLEKENQYDGFFAVDVTDEGYEALVLGAAPATAYMLQVLSGLTLSWSEDMSPYVFGPDDTLYSMQLDREYRNMGWLIDNNRVICSIDIGPRHIILFARK